MRVPLMWMPTMSLSECITQFLLILIPVVVLSLINSRRSR